MFDVDGVRYPKDGVSIHYSSNGYLDQYKDPESFCREYVGEELLNTFISYTDMKKKYPVQVLDLRFQVHHINTKKVQLHQEYRGAAKSARMFMIIIRHRDIEMFSDEKKINEVTVI